MAKFDWPIIGILALLIVLGFGLRVTQLGAIGFAEDEMNKLDAIHAYERGDFTANSEHPMVMKVLMWASLRGIPGSEEAALRFPNVLIGALTVIPLFLLTAAFFDRWHALLASTFWALGINAITLNRIGKEDSLLVFFMLFGFYFFLRAKQIPAADMSARNKRYAASAAAFGLMIASKYFPHYFGLNLLFHHNFKVRKTVAGDLSGKIPRWFFLVVIGVFLLASPAVLLPEVWKYMDAYTGERLLTHSGYLFGGELYKNNMSSSPFWGTPIYFYLLFLAIKVPILILVAFLIGIVISVKRFRHVGHAFVLFMFVFWIVPYSLIGGKWLRYTLSLMPFVYMLAAVGVIGLIRWISERVIEFRQVVAVVITALFVGLPAWTAFANRPHYALYTNALGGGKAGFYFPHDEFYDDGLREGIKYVCEVAPSGATIAHETPAVTRYYLARFGRSDLNSQAISSKDFDLRTATGPVYVIVQKGRTYFENRDELDHVRANFQRVHEIKIDGATAVEVYVSPQITQITQK